MRVKDGRSLGDQLCEFVDGASRLIVISPFIKRTALIRVLAGLSSEAELQVFTRWKAHEVASGASDVSVFEIVEELGGQVYLHPLLHAKVYIADARVLAGSCNLTMTGLGWSSAPAIETLFSISLETSEVTSLLELLAESACRATRAIRDEVAERASNLDPGRSMEQYKEEEGAQSEIGEMAFWVPRYNVPESAWAAYRGMRSPEVIRLVKRDLAALGVPDGIRGKEEFEAIVSSSLTQGFTGRLIQECSNVNAVDAADKFKRILAEVDHDIPEGQLGERYQAFVRWVSHFISGQTLRATGFSLS